jgi:Tfp pilus assembly protein PilN
MSQGLHPRLIVEWSPGFVRAYTPGGESFKVGDSVAAATAGLPTSDVLVALSRRSSFVRALRVPNAARAEVTIILANTLPNVIPLAGSELSFDFQLTDDINADGRLALVAAMQADHLRQLHDECQEAGIDLRATIPAALGASILLKQKGFVDGAVVETQPDGTSVDIVQSGVLRYSRWTPATEEIAGEVARTFAAAGIPPMPTLAAGGSTFPAEGSASESTLRALADFDLLHPPLNIELSEVRAARELKSKRNAIRVAGLVLAAGLAASSFIGFERYKAQATINSERDRLINSLAELDKEKSKVQSNEGVSEAQMATVARGFEPAQKLWEDVTVIVSDAPTGIWLTGLSLERGKELTIRGTSLTGNAVADYSRILATEPRFRNVQLLFSSDATIDNKPVTEFSISAFPKGNLPLIDAPGTGAVVSAGGSSS